MNAHGCKQKGQSPCNCRTGSFLLFNLPFTWEVCIYTFFSTKFKKIISFYKLCLSPVPVVGFCQYLSQNFMINYFLALAIERYFVLLQQKYFSREVKTISID
jgi:hypothetical protein